MPKKKSTPLPETPDLMGELFGEADRIVTLLTQTGQPRKRAPGGGRPRSGAKALTVQSYRLSPEQHAWLRARPGGASAALRALIDAAMQEETNATETP